jgi:hypothetical protein
MKYYISVSEAAFRYHVPTSGERGFKLQASMYLTTPTDFAHKVSVSWRDQGVC